MGALLGNLLEGLPTGDFERRMKEARGMERLIPKRLRKRATFTGDWKIC
jgi:hypothetical protein